MRLFGKKIIPGVKIEVDTDNTDDATNNKNGIAQCLGLKYYGCKQCTTETTILVQVRYRNRNPNWPILSADSVTNTKTDTVTDTKTTFQRQLPIVRGIFSIIKGPLEPNLLPNIEDYSLFLKICVQFQAFKNLYPHKNQKNMRIFEKKVSVS